MSTRRLTAIPEVPIAIKKVFACAPNPVSPEEKVWRERAARMTLDALGHTNLTAKPHEHNDAISYARRWFRGIFDQRDVTEVDSALATFDCAGIPFKDVLEQVLVFRPPLLETPDDGDNTPTGTRPEPAH